MRYYKDYEELDGNKPIKELLNNRRSFTFLKGRTLVNVFRGLLNPVDYDGRHLREIKKAYKTNEIGFFITVAFFLCLSWSFLTYRRSSILA